jgi:predicted  nucleic acid-binding Zn ribbon protein
MLHTKSCPRCSGDLALVQDIGDTYYSCVQCGHVSYQLKETRRQLEPALPAAR